MDKYKKVPQGDGGKRGIVEIYGKESLVDTVNTEGIETGSTYVSVDTGAIFMLEELFDDKGKTIGYKWHRW
jgi:hypothetical protein